MDPVDGEVQVWVAPILVADRDGLVTVEVQPAEEPLGHSAHPRVARVVLRRHRDEQVVGGALDHAVALGRALHPPGRRGEGGGG